MRPTLGDGTTTSEVHRPRLLRVALPHARLCAGARRKWGDGRAALVALVRIDGLPGDVSRERGGLLQTTALAIESGRIDAIYVTRNPDKLHHVAQAVAAEPGLGDARGTGAGPS